MSFIRHFPLFFTTSLVITTPLITNESTNYFCSNEGIKYLLEQNAPMQNDIGMQSNLAIPLNINLMRSTQSRKRFILNLAFLHPRNNQCNQKILFLPVPPQNLKFPVVEVLPNQQVGLSGRVLQKKCMPRNPVAFPFVMRGNVGSLIVSSSCFSSK